MDNTLICPACGELAGVLLCDINEFFCKKCSIAGNTEMWKCLTQSQRDLKIARQALEKIKDDIWSNRRITARTALEQITHDNKD